MSLAKLKKEREDIENDIEEGIWCPKTSSGSEYTPNRVRGMIRKYMAENNINQAEFLRRTNLNSNSFGKFMNAKYYKDPWSAVQNGTYNAASKFIILDNLDQKIAKLEAKKEMKTPSKMSAVSAEGTLSGKKRQASDVEKSSQQASILNFLGKAVTAANTPTVDDSKPSGIASSGPIIEAHRTSPAAVADTRPKKKTKAKMQALLDTITAVDVPDDVPIYANCDQIRRMIEKFLRESGVNQTNFLNSIGSAPRSYTSFMGFKGKGAGASNSVYWKSYRFFEQKRILEGKPKSQNRLEQEKRWGAEGFPRQHDDGRRLVCMDMEIHPDIYDIEKCQDNLKASAARGDEMSQWVLERNGLGVL